MTASPNSFGRALALIGDRWNLEIIREAFVGADCFSDWQQALPISDAVLARRLNDLLVAGVLAKDDAYQLSDSGKAMWKIFVSLWLWDRRWSGSEQALPKLRHSLCHQPIIPNLECGACHGSPTDVRAEPEDLSFENANPPRRYRRSPRQTRLPVRAVEILGDRWTAGIVGAAFMGTHRYSAFAKRLGAISPTTLSNRMNSLAENDILERSEREGHHAHYRLTERGLALLPLVTSLAEWANAWMPGSARTPQLTLRHGTCGKEFVASLRCDHCQKILKRHEIRFSAEGAHDVD
ncbi:MAG: winged helix-turn-helix transcriptional regulator [Myxococcota bacterium]